MALHPRGNGGQRRTSSGLQGSLRRLVVAAGLLALTLGAVGCRRAEEAAATVRPAAPSATAAPPQGAPPPSAKPGPSRPDPAPAPAPAPPPADKGLPKGVDAADLDAAERKILGEVLDEQFCPCGKPRSFRASIEAGDCALAPRLARFCVHQLQQGYGKRKVVGALLREIERLNTVVQLDLGQAPRLGPADAKVVVAIFSDFECPFCKRAAAPLMKLQRHYGVALAFLHYPLEMAHPHAEGAARAAWAAQRQGKFWPMHDALFARSPDLDWPGVQQVAKGLGLDAGRFARDVESDAAKAAVVADKAQGQKAGVDGTPTFFVNGRRAETIEQLQEGIREALGLAGQKVPDALDLGAADAVEPPALGASGAAQPAPAAAEPTP